MRESGHLAVHTVEVSGRPLVSAPLDPKGRLVVMGDRDDVSHVLERVAALPGTAVVPAPDGARRLSVTAYLRRVAGSGTPQQGEPEPVDPDHALDAYGLSYDRLRRTRLGDLGPDTRVRLHLAAALVSGAQWPILDNPFAGLPGDLRAGVRGRLLGVCEEFGLGLVLASNDLLDAATTGGTTVVVEKGQVADAGELAAMLRSPRSNLAASFAGVNVFSGLARRGWLSIGHSQVRARTELDGKVFVTIPTDATTMSFDEFDPVFTAETVFEALIVGIRDRGGRLQIVVSPSDTEVGLAMTADVLDFRSPPGGPGHPQPNPESDPNHDAEAPPASTTEASPQWGVLHPGLGATVAETLANVRVGARVHIEVDTSRMHAYPVDVD